MYGFKKIICIFPIFQLWMWSVSDDFKQHNPCWHIVWFPRISRLDGHKLAKTAIDWTKFSMLPGIFKTACRSIKNELYSTMHFIVRILSANLGPPFELGNICVLARRRPHIAPNQTWNRTPEQLKAERPAQPETLWAQFLHSSPHKIVLSSEVET